MIYFYLSEPDLGTVLHGIPLSLWVFLYIWQHIDKTSKAPITLRHVAMDVATRLWSGVLMPMMEKAARCSKTVTPEKPLKKGNMSE